MLIDLRERDDVYGQMFAHLVDCLVKTLAVNMDLSVGRVVAILLDIADRGCVKIRDQ